jgi:apolipoprotein N-acyltransferase
MTRFKAELEGKEWNFAAMICYEDTDAQLNRKLVYTPQSGKADWLLNISNDGWYVSYEEDEIKPSTELPQRTAISVFRAIENRITLMRSVNTGISCKIDPTGRIIDGYKDGNLPKRAFDRQAVAGWFTDRPEIDPRITFFTKYGTIFSKITGFILALLLLLPSQIKFRLRKKAQIDV